jgi:hypothetical protein
LRAVEKTFMLVGSFLVERSILAPIVLIFLLNGVGVIITSLPSGY